MFSSVDFFNGHQDALLVVAIAPLRAARVVLLAPQRCCGIRATRSASRGCSGRRLRSGGR